MCDITAQGQIFNHARHTRWQWTRQKAFARSIRYMGTNQSNQTILEYCSPLFVGINQKLSVKLERIQTRFHNLLCNINCNCNNLVCLKTRRLNAFMKLFTRISADSEHLLHNLIPECHRKLYCMPFCRTTRRLTSFIPTVTLLVNSADLT